MSSTKLPQATEPATLATTGAATPNDPVDVPPRIDSREEGSFAWTVLHERHPVLIQRVLNAHPYGPEQQRGLATLGEEIINGTIQPLGEHAHDARAWQAWGQAYFGRGWFEVPFLWAESYFYRRLLDAVGYFTPGPWFRIDPFESFKAAELTDPDLSTDLNAMSTAEPPGTAGRRDDLLLGSTWGNRADLGFRMSSPDHKGAAVVTELVSDDRDLFWSLLAADPGRAVSVVADNAGRELLADLLLIDHLISTGLAGRVDLHLKPGPYYVSDALTTDLIAVLRRLKAAPGAPAAAAGRLWEAMGQGRLRVSTHWFHCAPWAFDQMPTDLARSFTSASLTIFKGDLNYRRLVGDRAWDPETSFSETTRYFPGPVAALRTLKSDVVVGLDPATTATLDAGGKSWRTSGTHALIQARA